MEREGRTIVVVGATGLQGGAVSRRLLEEGWRVLALTRDPDATRARELAALGATVARADSEDRAALERSFAGAHGVYSVQNHHISGYEGEIRQGKNVVEAAVAANVSHLVYASTGNGLAGTGIGSWETKVAVAEHARRLGAPLTVLRPTAFMELMTEKRFYPQASVWHVMPKIMGEARPVGWLTVEDLAVIAEKAFADPATFVGTDVSLAGDVLSIQQCRDVWREVMGRPPRRFPMPVRLFERFTGSDETTMWKWLRENDMQFDTKPTCDIHAGARTLRDWLAHRKG